MAIAAAIFVTGCAANSRPIVDTKGVNMTEYEQDLAECMAYGEEIQVSTGVAKGAATGAAIGAITGAIGGNADRTAGYGGIYGGTRSGLDADRDKQRLVKRCLRGRGYNVLN